MCRGSLEACRFARGRRGAAVRARLLATLVVVKGVADTVTSTWADQERPELLDVAFVVVINRLDCVGLALGQRVVRCLGSIRAGSD